MFDSFDSYIVWLIMGAVLAGYVGSLVIMELRLRAEQARWRSQAVGSPGKGMDVSAIAPQIQHVRENHVATLHRSPHPASHRAELIAASRRLIANLPFFRDAKAEPENLRDES